MLAVLDSVKRQHIGNMSGLAALAWQEFFLNVASTSDIITSVENNNKQPKNKMTSPVPDVSGKHYTIRANSLVHFPT